MKKKLLPDISLKDLLEVGCHFGHTTSRFNPKIKPYIYTIKNKVVIFDLAQTKEKLEEAAKFLFKIAAQGGEIVLVGTKRQAAEVVKEEAIKSKSFYVNSRWWGGTLTNWKEISKRLELLIESEKKLAEGGFDHYTKLERLKIERKLQRLHHFLSGLIGFSGRPAALVVIDVKKEATAVKEAHLIGVPVVAIVDSNIDPELVDYPIPANDDAVASIKLILSFLSKAIQTGRQETEKKGAKKSSKKENEEEEKQTEDTKTKVKTEKTSSKTAAEKRVVKKAVKKLSPSKKVAAKPAAKAKKTAKKTKVSKKVSSKKETK